MDLFQQRWCNCHQLEYSTRERWVTGASHWKLCVGWTMTTWRLSEVCARWMLWEVHSGGHLLISGKPTSSHVGLSRRIGGLGFVLKARRVQLAHDFPWEVSACWEEVWDTFLGWMPRNTARTTPEAGLMMSTLILFSLSLWSPVGSSGRSPEGEEVLDQRAPQQISDQSL